MFVLIISAAYLLAFLNVRIFFFSFAEIILISVFCLGLLIKKIKFYRIEVLFILFFGTLYFFSGLFHEKYTFERSINFIGFAYKYLFVAIILAISRNFDFPQSSLNRIVRFLWALFFLWTNLFIFYLSNVFEIIAGFQQVSFPRIFIEGQESVDSHLFAYCFGFTGLYLFFYEKRFNYVYLLLTLIGIALTGSRNPFALYLIVLVISFAVLIFRNNNLVPISLFIITISAVAVISLIAYEDIAELFPSSRSFSFNFSDDGSSLSRIRKFIIAVQGIGNGNFILGESVFNSNLLWADGIHSMLIIHFGILGLFIYLYLFFILLSTIFRLEAKISRYPKLFLLSVYAFVGLFITEFILVGRGAIIVFLPLAISYFNLKKAS